MTDPHVSTAATNRLGDDLGNAWGGGYPRRMILAGDIGGTKTHLALFPPDGRARKPSVDRIYSSHDHASPDRLIASFLSEAGVRPTRVVLGIAGPVVNNRAEITNLPWAIDGQALSESLGADVRLINDLEATGWGIMTLDAPGDLAPLHDGQAARSGNGALIAAGTGLGEAPLIWNGEDWTPSASEGGHADFGPRDTLEDELLGWLRARYGHVSYERILSGPGIADLYRFLRDTGRGDEPGDVRARFDTAADPAVIVTETALAGTCERAVLALERFCSIYGAEAGNVALKFLAVGGVFVSGGIAPRILPFLNRGGFERAFLDKGRLRGVVERIPVTVVLDPATALWGAAAVALLESRGHTLPSGSR
jgi:glucokinase